VLRPSILFLDKPTSGLGRIGIKPPSDIVALLNTENGMMIFTNPHMISEIGRTCTLIGVL